MTYGSSSKLPPLARVNSPLWLAFPRGVAALHDDLLKAGPACGPQDAELFTGSDGEDDAARPVREEKAKAICAGCPARLECLAYALALRPVEGVWAGRSAQDINVLALHWRAA